MRQAWWVCLVLLLGGAAPEPELSRADATGVLGRRAVDASGKEVGRIVDVLVEASGQPRAIVIDVGGFLGVGMRRVAVAWGAVHIPAPDVAGAHVSIDMQDDQIRAAPEYTDPTKPATVVGPGPAPALAPPDSPPDHAAAK